MILVIRRLRRNGASNTGRTWHEYNLGEQTVHGLHRHCTSRVAWCDSARVTRTCAHAKAVFKSNTKLRKGNIQQKKRHRHTHAHTHRHTLCRYFQFYNYLASILYSQSSSSYIGVLFSSCVLTTIHFERSMVCAGQTLSIFFEVFFIAISVYLWQSRSIQHMQIE